MSSELILYTSEDGAARIQLRVDGGTVWVSQAELAELFQTTPQNITLHIKAIYAAGELRSEATCKECLQVRAEGSRQVQRSLKTYNLDLILAVGYRVRSHRGTQFRQWATTHLREYLVKGFVLDDRRLKDPGGQDYFGELLARIRDIRSSEKVFWRKVLEIYATSADYDPRAEDSQAFFATVKNKMHWAAHGHTAAEVIHQRADGNPQKGRILMSRANTPSLVGASAYISEDFPGIFLPDKLWQLEPNHHEKFSMRWLAYLLGSPPYRKKLGEMATGSSPSMKNISKEQVLGLNLYVPSFSEQELIAEVLSHWDIAIEKTERIFQIKSERFGSPVNHLYQSSDRAGQEKAVGHFLQESFIPGESGENARKLTVKLYEKGAVPKEEKRIGSEKTKYFVRRSGQLIYSKLDFRNGAFAVIPSPLDRYESTLDLPAFDINPEVEPGWLLGNLTRPNSYTRQVGLARGQRNARRVHPSDFLASTIRVPPLPFQKKIAAAIAVAKDELETSQQLLQFFRLQKRGLMQKLLTGRWRLPADLPEAPR